ncbi:MAG: sigma 54-interacting transcriptional regulator, partial [Pirellulaceae bacterium]
MQPASRDTGEISQPDLCVFAQSTGADDAEAAPGIVYRSRAIHELVTRARAFARSSATVLITGENGTGKELFAKLIHEASQRSSEKFGQVNCAALSESLTESELFGHEKGAFTGADRTRVGRFEWAEGGTLLLDEICEIPVSTQAKLLRVLEENEFQRVGSNETLLSNVRVVATANRDLAEQVSQGNFREDLFYRLNVLRIHLPSLRERPEDVPL